MIDPLWTATAASLAGAFQATAIALHGLRLRRDRRAPSPDPLGVTVTVPCKGRIDTENLGTLLRQDHPGRTEFLFVVPSENDPAATLLRDFLRAHPDPRARVLSSEARPTSCGEALLNCLHGALNAAPESEVLVFIDADLRVEKDWLRRLVSALREPGVGVATSAMIPLPPEGAEGPWPLWASAWMILLLPVYGLSPDVLGHSYALRRKDFLRWGVADLWRRGITTDAPLTGAVRRAGRRIRYVPHAAPVGFWAPDARAFLRVFGKWLVYSRLYTPVKWTAFLLCVLAKLALYAAAALSRSPVETLSLVFFWDFLYGFAAARTLMRHLPERMRTLPPRAALLIGLSAPLIWLLYLASFLKSIWTRTIVWGGYTYRLRGPYSVEVLR